MRAGGAAFMVEPTSPFRLSRGQWTLVIEAWRAWDETRRARVGAPGADESTPSSLGMHDTAVPGGLAPISTVFDLTQPTAPTHATMGNNDNGGLAPFGAWTVHSDAAEPTEHWARDPFQAPDPTRAYEDAGGARDDEPPYAEESTDVPAAVWVERFENLVRTSSRTQAQLDDALAQLARVKNGVDRLAEAMDEQMGLRVQQLRVLEAENRGLHGRVRELEERAPEAGTADWGIQLQLCHNGLFGAHGVVPTLAAQVQTFKDRIDSGGGIECNGVRFASMREALTWYTDKEVSTPGLFVDALALLHGVSGAYVSMAESGKRREIQGKNQYANDVEEFVIQSFDTTLPGSFVGGKKDVDGASAHAVLKSVLKTFQVWKPRGELTLGVAASISEGVRRRTNQMRVFRQAHTTDVEVKELSHGLLSDSARFCQDLVAFVNEQNDALTHDTTYSAEQIWDMQLECIRTIFQELADARSEFVLPAQSAPGYYLWGMLRAWEVQQRYLRNNFKDDPALMGIFVRRVVLQSGNDGIKDKLVKLDKLQDQVLEHHRQHTQAIKKLEIAVSKGKS
jgi:hypothetical protein